jgi:mannose-6-phosphate isomerase-like protein (cupin superfamily)
MHSDPIDVLIECLDGKKLMEVAGKEIVLEPNNTVYIQANTPHRALNYEKALTISYGINDTETLSRIRKND